MPLLYCYCTLLQAFTVMQMNRSYLRTFTRGHLKIFGTNIAFAQNFASFILCRFSRIIIILFPFYCPVKDNYKLVLNLRKLE